MEGEPDHILITKRRRGMTTVISGVTEREGKFVWGCSTCGQVSDEFEDRELARNSYRLHRRELCKGPGTVDAEVVRTVTDDSQATEPKQEPDSTNAVEQSGTESENSTMSTAVAKKVAKKPAAKKAATPAAKKAAAKSPAKKAAPKAAKNGAAPAAAKEKKTRAPRGQGEGKNRLRIFRLATVKNEKTGRDVTIRVKEDGTPRSAFAHLSAPTSWTEVEARSRKEAVKKFNDGEGTKRRASK